MTASGIATLATDQLRDRIVRKGQGTSYVVKVVGTLARFGLRARFVGMRRRRRLYLPATFTSSCRHNGVRHDTFGDTRHGDRVRQRNIHRLCHRSRLVARGLRRRRRICSCRGHIHVEQPRAGRPHGERARARRGAKCRCLARGIHVDRGHPGTGYDVGELTCRAFQFRERHVLVQLQ